MKTVLIGVLAASSLAGLGASLAWWRGDDHRSPPAIPVPGQVAANGAIEGARREVPLRPEIAGIIAAIHFRENQDVSPGQLLVELRNETQKQQVALARAEVELARAQYQQADTEWQRTQRLRSVESQERMDAQYYRQRQTQAQVDKAEAQWKLAEAELAKTRLVAPSAGHIVQVNAEPGETVGPTSARPVLILADLSVRRARAFIEELDALRVHVGEPATITVDGLAGREFRGRVAEVLPRMAREGPQTDAPDEYRDLYFRQVLIDLDDARELLPNLRVKVKIRVE
jgi:RND family efflux transporter MFP subunit